MTAGYFVVCAVGNGALLISVGSVLQSLSLGCAEPASFAQGSQNKIIYCDKNLLAKLVVTGFCAAYAAAVRRGRRTLQVCCNKIVQILLFQLFLAANAFIRSVGAGSGRNEA